MTESVPKSFKFPVPGPIETKQISKNTYAVYGGMGANSYFLVGKTSVLVIDAKMTEEFGKALIEEIEKITALPISRMILTHSDLDHVNGLSAFPKDMQITATEKTRSEMKDEFERSGLRALVPYLPNDTFTKEKTIDFEGENLILSFIAPAHTGGDTVIFMPSKKLAFVGDLLVHGRPLLIHARKGGSSAGLLETLRFLMSLDCDTYLSGHAIPLNKNAVELLAKSVESVREKVITLKKQGKSLDEMKAELNVAELEMPPGRPRFPSLEEVIYDEN